MTDQVEKTEKENRRDDEEGMLPSFRPAVDIYENADGYLLEAFMPGVDTDSVDVTVEDGVLYLEGRSANGRHDGYTLVREEYGPVKYRRAFDLSDRVNVEGIKAKVRDGVLRLLVPKGEQTKPRKVEIASG
ncbi:MAG: Hsp20/alpha crystallin family protein [Kiritimatiellia bacterium]